MECTYRPTKAEEDVLVRLATLDGIRAHGDDLPLRSLSSTIARVFRAGLEALEYAEGHHLRGSLLLAVFRGPEGEELLSVGTGSTKDAERLWSERGASDAVALDVYRLESSEDEPLRAVRLVRFGPG